MAYRIVFIDEEETAHFSFRRGLIAKNKEEFSGITLFPKSSILETLDDIFETHPDAILTDFQLNEMKTDITYNVPFTGAELANAIREKRKDFPVFIVTTFGDDAARNDADVRLIYEKKESFDSANIAGDGQKLTFAKKLHYAIQAYKQSLENCSNEFDALLEKRQRDDAGLTHAEETRLIELDAMLEESIDRKSRMPDEFKYSTNAIQLEKLLSCANQILKRITDE